MNLCTTVAVGPVDDGHLGLARSDGIERLMVIEGKRDPGELREILKDKVLLLPSGLSAGGYAVSERFEQLITSLFKPITSNVSFLPSYPSIFKYVQRGVGVGVCENPVLITPRGAADTGARQ